MASLEEQFCEYTLLFLIFLHPKVLCFLIGYFNALGHVLGTPPCKLTSVPEFLLPRKALYLTAPSWRTFARFQVSALSETLPDLSLYAKLLFPLVHPFQVQLDPRSRISGSMAKAVLKVLDVCVCCFLSGWCCVPAPRCPKGSCAHSLSWGGVGDQSLAVSSFPMRDYCQDGLDTHVEGKSPGCVRLPIFL